MQFIDSSKDLSQYRGKCSFSHRYKNYAEEFEKTAVINNNLSGGVDNSDIPNFVYRWTEREVYKLISSYRPQIKHKIKFYYGNDVKLFRNFFLKFLFMIFFKVFKKQQNLFAFYIDKVN